MPADVSSAEQATIPGYRVKAELPGRAREGALYRAETEDGREAELWVVPARDSESTARFLEGADALAALTNEHLPRILGSGESEGSLYLAAEPSEGKSLQELIDHGGGLAPMRAVRLLGETADALDAAHGAGVQHGSLRPSSVVVEGRTVERAVLRDFDLGHEAAAQDDIRAFAALIFECFTGSAPSGEARTGLSRDVDAVLARGLSDDPRERPGTAAELVSDAAKAVMGTAPAPAVAPTPAPTVATDTPPQVVEPVPTYSTRVPLRRRLAGATVPLFLAVLVVVAAAFGGWLVGKPDPAADTPKKVSSGTVELGLPGGWTRTRPSSRMGGVSLREAMSAAGPSGGRVTAGLVRGTLPSRVAERVGRHPGGPDAVRLGDLQAYRWRGLDERGRGGRITLFAAATDGGLVALGCTGTAAAIARCENAAGSLAAPGSQPAKLSELRDWTGRLDRVMRRLARRRQRDRARLRAARTPTGASRAARRLATDYAAARRSLAAEEAPVGAAGAQANLERYLSGIAISYRRLGRAARRQRRASYRSARRSVARSERSLTRTLRGL